MVSDTISRRRFITSSAAALAAPASLLFAIMMLSPISAIAQESRDQHDVILARRSSDDYARAIVANRRDYLYGHVAERVRAAYPQQEFFRGLDLAREYIGDIQTIQFVANGVGVQMGVYGKFDVVTYDYSVTSTRNLSGLFLRIQIDRSDTSHSLVGYVIGKHLGITGLTQ